MSMPVKGVPQTHSHQALLRGSRTPDQPHCGLLLLSPLITVAVCELQPKATTQVLRDKSVLWGTIKILNGSKMFLTSLHHKVKKPECLWGDPKTN